MKKIKRYKEFIRINEEEGWKEKAMAAAIAAGSMMGGAKAATVGDDYTKPKTEISYEKPKEKEDDKKYSKRVVTTKAELDRLQKLSWTLDSTTVDTIFDIISKKPVDVLVSELNFKERQYFPSGEYDVNDDIISGLDSTINDLNSKGYILMDVILESSTDKQQLSSRLKKRLEESGYSGDNSGLARARSESIGNYLVSIGIDSSIINSKEIVGGGSGEIDESARYVTVKFACLKREVVEAPDVIKEIRETYFLSKEKSSGKKIGKDKPPKNTKFKTPKSQRIVKPFDYCPERSFFSKLFQKK